MIPAEPPHTPVIPPPRFFFAVSIGAGFFFALWSWLVHGHTSIPAFDDQCALYWHEWGATHTRPWGFMVFMTDLGGVAAITLMAIMGAIWQTAINHRVMAIAWLGIIIGSGLFNVALKNVADRPRPPVEIRDRAVLENNHSYPSGHSMGSAVGYGMLGYALVLPQRRRPRRIVTVLLLTGIVLLIGFSRIYLRAHWFSDVIGGWSIGVCWLFFCLGCLEWRRRRDKHPLPSPTA